MLQAAQDTLLETDTSRPRVPGDAPTLWGLTPAQLHDRFWAARGVQVVRPSTETELAPGAELFLLLGPRMQCLFRLAPLVDRLSWECPEMLWVHVLDQRDHEYAEYAVRDDGGYFQRYHRSYPGSETHMRRVVLTSDRELASLWQRADDARAGRARLRRATARHRRSICRQNGLIFDGSRDVEMMRFVRELVRMWNSPDTTIAGIRSPQRDVWQDPDATITGDTTFIGPVWIGAGRSLKDAGSVVGPAVLWDDPNTRPQPDMVVWHEIEPGSPWRTPVATRQLSTVERAGKRAFDVLFSLMVLALTLPFYPLIMLAIWLEDGRPFFFAHHRQGRGGKTFPCIKFRSMRRDAEQIKAQIMAANQVDGPQFYMDDDPRLTRVGRFIRKTNIDELPQFINVLLGQMSVIGPRPSPDAENQYCPPWREARLSVRPGITGLWQVRRSRDPSLDFQEWIRYDIEYVENMGWRLDMRILIETFRVLIRGT